MTPTVQQEAFLEALVSTTSHLALVARAGCGKTSTILLGVDRISKRFPKAETLVCAFNKAIAEEVGTKLIKAGHDDWKRVQASTLHSLGFSLLKFVFKPRIDEKKTAKIIDSRPEPIYQEFRSQIIDLVAYAKQAGVGFFPDLPINDVKTWHDLADHFDVNSFDDTTMTEDMVDCAIRIYHESLRITDVVDFDDMILFPLIKNLRVKFGKDFIFLDEAQDLSRTRQALARKFLKYPGGRMIVVGDDRQAIYGFTGADASALPNLIKSLNATVLPLSVTWRCPNSVVRVAQQWVPDIEAAPGAHEGFVGSLKELPDDIDVGDAILCRNMAPLVTLAYKLIRAGKPAKVEGRNIGDGLIALSKRWKVKTIDTLLTRLETYKEREIQKAMAKDNEQKAQEVEDKVGTLVEICGACLTAGKTTVADVEVFINSLFADGDTAATTLATYHRSKGREWERVFLFEHSTRCPSRAARQEWQLEQEDNLAYVAVTRAQGELFFVGE